MNQYQFAAPKLSRINKILLIATGVCFLAHSILTAVGAFSLVSYLGLSSNGFFSGLVFQALTYPLVEVQLMSFLFNGLVVWFFGSELESMWGEKVYLRFLFINVLIVALIYVVVNFLIFKGTNLYYGPIHGLSGINFSLLAAYAMLYPDRQMSFMMIFPMRARTFCWILAGIEAYMALFSSLSSAWAHLFAMGTSYLIIRYQRHVLVQKILNQSLIPAKKQSKNNLYLIKDDDKNPPKFWQ